MFQSIRSRSWQDHFLTLEHALRTVERRPHLFDEAIKRWSLSEPSLTGLTTSDVFADQNLHRPSRRLTDPQSRALVRAARSEDPHAELATWSLIYQFVNSIIKAAQIAESKYRQPTRDSVDTAIADLYESIQRISLEANNASIFFALSRMMHKAVVRPKTLIADEAPFDHQRHSERRPELRHLLPPAAEDPEIALIDWATTVDSLTDLLADDLIEALGWDRETIYFESRRSRLRSFVAYRVSEAATRERSSATAIARELGEPIDTIKILQASVNKVWTETGMQIRPAVCEMIGMAA